MGSMSAHYLLWKKRLHYTFDCAFSGVLLMTHRRVIGP